MLGYLKMSLAPSGRCRYSSHCKGYQILKLVLILILVILFFVFSGGKREGLRSYKECRKRGYTKEYCVQTPVGIGGPGTCRCRGGRLGRRIPGFRGECVCDYRYIY